MRYALIALCLGMALPANAQRPLEQTSDFWREVREPGTRRAQTLLRHGIRFYDMATDRALAEQPHMRAAHLESAIERFALARAHAPSDPAPLLWLARATGAYERPVRGSTPERRSREAIQLYLELQAMDAQYEALSVGADLGILYTRVGEFEPAAEAYESALRAAFDPNLTTTIHANLAEVYMMSGDLTSAVYHYEVAIELAPRLPPNLNPAQSLALARWGLSVAFDRLGEHHASLETARKALSVYGGSMEVLRSDGVFFDPPSEIHFYEGLGHLARAETLMAGEERTAAARSAEQSWRTYLALAEDEDPWIDLARRHLAEARALRR